ncbi:hypothetical protein PIB30_055966 [Stylosanthes scabra]|uniref:Uncharacterized protein n=1 Tax=Stylosanthes scabra TaxID=79078 RepID=A0ABU6SJ50_9FABA|nr:hypothetical protein [Stylosanthes scabra]
MPDSQVTKLWDGVQGTNLEKIDISYCEVLCELHSSIISIPALEDLKLNYCKELRIVKGEIHSESLRKLQFRGCSSLEEFSVSSSGQLSSLDLSSSRIRSPGNELCSFTCMQYLTLVNCRELSELPHNMKALSRLLSLNVSGCTNLRSIPELPSCIMHICAYNCTSLETIFSLKAALRLKWISFMNCMRLDQESLNTLTEDFLRPILKRMLLMKKAAGNGGLLLYSDETQQRFSFDACYPGSKVPGWFRCGTTEGASITVKIDKPYHQLMGFCVSCSVSQEFSPYYSIYCEYDLGDGEKYPLGTYYLNELRERWNTDHVCLWFHPFYNSGIRRAIQRCISTWNRIISFTFTAEGITSRQEDSFIKGCGVFPIYLNKLFFSPPSYSQSLMSVAKQQSSHTKI